MSTPSILQSAALCLLAVLPVAAEPEEKPAAKPVRHVRFFAVGDNPPFRQEIRDGVRYELDPPPGSIPPREVVPGFGKESAKAVALRLGRISTPVEVPAGEGPLDLRLAGDAPDSVPWLSLNRPESGDFLVFLFRNPAKGTWKNAANIIVTDGPDGAPAGTLRIVNLFPLAIRIMWDTETSVLPAGKTIVHTVNPGTETLFKVLTTDDAGAMKCYYSGAVTQNQGERGLVTIYRADGESPRRPLKVSMLREPVPPEVPPAGASKKP